MILIFLEVKSMFDEGAFVDFVYINFIHVVGQTKKSFHEQISQFHTQGSKVVQKSKSYDEQHIQTKII